MDDLRTVIDTPWQVVKVESGSGWVIEADENVPYIIDLGKPWAGRGGRLRSKPAPPAPAYMRAHGVSWRAVDKNDEHWIMLGHAPTPQTRWQWRRYHLLHGLLMGYPVLDVIAFIMRGDRRIRARRRSYGDQ